MTSECDHCDCADKTQCKNKNKDENTETLGPIYVYASPPPQRFERLEESVFNKLIHQSAFQGGYIQGGGDELPISELEYYFDRSSKQMTQTLNRLEKHFKREHKGISYDKAKQLYQKSLSSPKYKFTERQKRAIRNALSIDEIKRNQISANAMAKRFGVLGKVEDGLDLIDAVKQSLDKESWEPVLKAVAKVGVGAGIAWAATLFNPVSATGIAASVIFLAAASWYGDNRAIPFINELIDEKFVK